jgi:hypothetical protein
MVQHGADSEVHPAVRMISHWFGPVAGPLVGMLGKAAAGLAVAIYCRRWGPHILLTVSALSLWAAWYNVWGADLYCPNLLRYIPW